MSVLRKNVCISVIKFFTTSLQKITPDFRLLYLKTFHDIENINGIYKKRWNRIL